MEDHRRDMRVLLLGWDQELGQFRVHVLQREGFQVRFPQSKQEAVQAIREGGFEVALISYSLSNETAEELVELVRQHCDHCRVIAISETEWADDRLKPDATVSVTDGPNAMLLAVARMDRRRIRRVR